MFANPAVGPHDSIIEYYKQFVDRGALRENRRQTFEERLHWLQAKAGEHAAEHPRVRPIGPEQPWEPVSDCTPQRATDPVIELYKRDIDRTLLRENLKRTVSARFEGLQQMAELLEGFQTHDQTASSGADRYGE